MFAYGTLKCQVGMQIFITFFLFFEGLRCSLQRDYYHIHKTVETLLWGVENVWLDTSKLNDNRKEKVQIFLLDSNEVKWRSNGDFFFNILLTRFFLLKKNPIITYSLKQGFMSSFSLTYSGWICWNTAELSRFLALYPYLHLLWLLSDRAPSHNTHDLVAFVQLPTHTICFKLLNIRTSVHFSERHRFFTLPYCTFRHSFKEKCPLSGAKTQVKYVNPEIFLFHIHIHIHIRYIAVFYHVATEMYCGGSEFKYPGSVPKS